MRSPHRWSKLIAAPFLILVAGVFAQACAKQAEGERCDVQADCESGLTCRGKGVCCSAQSTLEDRRTGGTNPGTDTGVSTDTSGADTTPSESGPDDADAAPADAPDTASPDAETDAADVTDATDAADAG